MLEGSTEWAGIQSSCDQQTLPGWQRIMGWCELVRAMLPVAKKLA
jgi:hypothetical protein